MKVPKLHFQSWLLLLMEEILHQLIGSFSHYLQGFIHSRWCKISSTNSSTGFLLYIVCDRDQMNWHEVFFADRWSRPLFFRSSWEPLNLPEFRVPMAKTETQRCGSIDVIFSFKYHFYSLIPVDSAVVAIVGSWYASLQVHVVQS